ncbi:MAG: YdcH family protein [Gammaproteobacteria bacterium]
MFEHDQATVARLLDADDGFRRLYNKHSLLNAKVDQVNAGKAAMDDFELETLKKEKLLLRDQLQAMIHSKGLHA